MTDAKGFVQFVDWVAGVMAVLIAILPPLGYFTIFNGQLRGHMDQEAVYHAHTVTQFISVNPRYWRFEGSRLSSLIEQLNLNPAPMTLRALDSHGQPLVQLVQPLPSPLITSTAPFYLFGDQVGHIEVTQSMRPLLVKVGGVAALSTLLSILMFFVLRRMQLRALRQVTAALDQERNYVNNIIANMLESLVVVSPDGTIRTVNKTTLNLLGYTEQELLGQPIGLIIAEDRNEEASRDEASIVTGEGLAALVNKGGVANIEKIYKHKDGHRLSMLFFASAMHDEDGDVQGLVCMAADITAREKAEKSLQGSLDLLRSIIENIPARVFWKDTNLRYLGCNTLFAQDAGMASPDDMIGKDDYQMGWRDQAELYRADDQKVMDTDAAILSYDEPQTTPDGHQIWLRTSKVPMHASDGAVSGMLGIYEDITTLKQTELTLHASEKRFRDLVENSSDWIWEINTQGVFTYSSPMAEDLLGYDTEELIGTSPLDLMPAEEAQRVGRMMKAIFAEQRSFSGLENINLRKDGSQIVFETSGVPYFDDSGQFLGYRGIDRDVTSRKHAEETLRKSEASLSEAQRIAHMGSWTHDLDTELLTWSDEVYRIFEVDPETFEVSYATFLDLVHPDDRASVESAYHGSLKSGAAYESEHRLLLRDGQVKWVSERAQVVLDDRGKARHSIGMVLDITAPKLAETKLEEAMRKLELFRNTVDESSDAIFVMDAETGRFIDVNQTACTQLGYARDELLDMEITDIQTDLPNDIPWQQYVKTLRQPDGELIHGTSLRKDGTAFPVEMSIKAVTLDQTEHIIAIARDVTDRNETERALRYAQKIDALGNLAGGIAHNMNNLLLPIMSLTEMTLKDLPEDSRAHKRLRMVVKAAEEGKALVQQIMNFSRRSTEAGHEEVFELGDAVKEALNLVLVSVPSSIDVIEDLGAPGLNAVVDRDQITTVIMNVISNAVDAFEGKVGTLKISLAPIDVNDRRANQIPGLRLGRYGKITIGDNGKGMDEQTLERVFDPFFTTKEVGNGKGLGLSTVHSIVEKLNGTISISSAPKAGTTVDIYLPLMDKQTE